MQYEILRGYRRDDSLRTSFNRLAQATFGLDFEPWYQNGFWNEKYDPHSVLLDGRIVANVSVNHIDGLLDGQTRHYIQLGTVMTDPAYRRRGLVRAIMTDILAQYSRCDGIYLYANDQVIDFYPKFGFRRAEETRWELPAPRSSGTPVERVPMQVAAHWQAFLRAKRTLSSAAAFQMDIDDLNMFYLTQFMRDCVYFLPTSGAFVIAEADGDALVLHDVLSPAPVCLHDICAAFAAQYRRFVFSFTPADTGGLRPFVYTEEDSAFFVQGEPLFADLGRIGSFPGISRA